MYLRAITKCGVDDFKLQLDNYLGKIPDEPSSPGLTPSAQDPVTAKASNSTHTRLTPPD